MPCATVCQFVHLANLAKLGAVVNKFIRIVAWMYGTARLGAQGGVYLSNVFGMRKERKEVCRYRSDNFFWGEPWINLLFSILN